MEHPKLRDSKRLLTHEPYPLNEIPEKIITEIGKRLVYLLCIGRTDLTGNDWGKVFAEAIDGKHLQSPLGIADVEYKKINGDQAKEQVKDIVWGYKEKVDGERPIDFQLNIVANAREITKSSSGKAHLIADVSMEYYTKKTSAKRLHQKTIDREITNDIEYIKEHPTIVIASFTTSGGTE